MTRLLFLLVSLSAAVITHAEDNKLGVAVGGTVGSGTVSGAVSSGAVSSSAVSSGAVSSGNYVEVILGLAVVLALIYALAYAARRLNGAAFPGNLPIKILGGTSLGVREKVVLIDVGGKHILLGVAPGRVNTLHVFEEPLDLIREKRAEAAFAVRLKQILSQGENK